MCAGISIIGVIGGGLIEVVSTSLTNRRIEWNRRSTSFLEDLDLQVIVLPGDHRVQNWHEKNADE